MNLKDLLKYLKIKIFVQLYKNKTNFLSLLDDSKTFLRKLHMYFIQIIDKQ